MKQAARAPATVEMRSVRKRFGSVDALSDASLRAFPGEIHALLGENGAGKTTLMRVLCGALRPDAGDVRVDGGQPRPGRARDAILAGIGMVHQHFTLVPSLTVAENVALGTRDGGGARLRLDDLPIPPSAAGMFQPIPASEVGIDISSTELRNRSAPKCHSERSEESKDAGPSPRP